VVLRNSVSATSYKRSEAEDPGLAKISVQDAVGAIQGLL
jgi:hypothetical protein